MSSNPNNAVGTNGAYGGRTSVNALNDNLAAYSRGILSGWACSPNSGLTVSLGGDGTTRDVAIAEDNAGNKTTINNISGSPIDVTLSAAPASNSRIDLVVAYVDNPPQGTNTETDNPGACGIIAVSGNAALSPTAPDDNAIRTAITADGASGTTAYYVVLANITVTSGTTDITSSDIKAGDASLLTGTGIIMADNIDYSTLPHYKFYTNNVAVPTTATTVATYLIPSAGDYYISVSMNIHAINSAHATYITVSNNGTSMDSSYVGTEANDWGYLGVSGTFTVAAGDSITVDIRDTVGITASTNTRIRVSIFKVG